MTLQIELCVLHLAVSLLLTTWSLPLELSQQVMWEGRRVEVRGRGVGVVRGRTALRGVVTLRRYCGRGNRWWCKETFHRGKKQLEE